MPVNFNPNPTTDYEALVLALKLAVTAPTNDKAQACLQVIENLNVSAHEIAKAKKETEKELNQ